MRFNTGTGWGSWMPFDAEHAVTLLAGDGEKTVSAEFKDAAGNTSTTLSDTIVLDANVPSGSITVEDGAAYTISPDVTVTASVDFSVSGAHASEAMRFDTGTGWSAWMAFSTDHEVTLPSGDGEKTVSAQFKDKAGNVSATLTDTIVLDTTAPAMTSLLSSSHPSEAVWYSSRDVSISWTAESASGIDGYSVSLSTNPAVTPD